MQRSHSHKSQDEGHKHKHGVTDPKIMTTERGKWAVKWSFIALMITALLQVASSFSVRQCGAFGGYPA
jgi:hypothetical protein